MIILLIISLLGIITGGIIFYFIGQFNNWYNYLILIGLVIAGFVIWFIIYGLFLLIYSSFCSNKKEIKKIPKFTSFIVRQTAALSTIMMNVRIKVINKELIPKSHALYVSNHTSGFDAMILLRALKVKPMSVVIKIEFINNLIAGKLFHQAGFIHIDRKDDFQAAKALIKGIDFLRHDEASVYICPEGTRNHESNSLLPYHAGSLKIAYKTKKPIVVMAIKNSDKIKNNHIIKPTKVILKIIKVYNYDDYKDINSNDLAEEIRQLTLENLEEM